MNTQFFFIKVSDNLSKLRTICQICQKHFMLRDNLLIFTQDKIAAAFIDELIWKMPQESFLPHVISATSCDEKIVITTIPRNLNQAQVLINLSSKVTTMSQEFATIYELLDETSEDKLKLSNERLQNYKAMNYPVTILSSL